MDEKRLVDGATALAEKQSRVIKIEPAERPQNVRLRVAAYTRVSSDSEDQLNSFAAQNRYYTELISGKAEWRMVDIYADEGITGTSVAKRDDFQRMMADCRRGLIDQILVKSISRFARNTKDCLQNIRELKELGVNVRFEREGIDTVNVSSELITAIYAAFAQKESESISGNMRWSYQRRMEQGAFNTYHAPVGFTLIDGSSKEALKGGYVIADSTKEIPDAIIIASGSEVSLAVEAKEILEKEGTDVRVVSMPCMDIFEQQSEEYKEAVLPKSCRKRVAVEALSDFGWGRYVGLDGAYVTMHSFGASAPADKLFKKFGITTENVVKAVRSL